MSVVAESQLAFLEVSFLHGAVSFVQLPLAVLAVQEQIADIVVPIRVDLAAEARAPVLRVHRLNDVIVVEDQPDDSMPLHCVFAELSLALVLGDVARGVILGSEGVVVFLMLHEEALMIIKVEEFLVQDVGSQEVN